MVPLFSPSDAGHLAQKASHRLGGLRRNTPQAKAYEASEGQAIDDFGIVNDQDVY